MFAGGFTLEAAEAVGSAEPLDELTVLDLVSRLVDKSLVHVEHGAGGSYRLLETIRLYAGQRLVEAGEADTTRGRHLAFFLDLGERAAHEATRTAGFRGAGQQAALDRLATNLDNLRAAYVWSVSGGCAESALRIATAMFSLWRMRGRRVEGSAWLDDALAASSMEATEERGSGSRGPEAQPGDVVDAREWLAINALLAGEPGESGRLIHEVTELAASLGNDYLVRAGTAWHALTLLMCGDARTALPILQDVVARTTQVGERTLAMYVLGWAGWEATAVRSFTGRARSRRGRLPQLTSAPSTPRPTSSTTGPARRWSKEAPWPPR